MTVSLGHGRCFSFFRFLLLLLKMQIMNNMPLSKAGPALMAPNMSAGLRGRGSREGRPMTLCIYICAQKTAFFFKKKGKAHKITLQQPRVQCPWGDANRAVAVDADLGFPGRFASQGITAAPSNRYLGCSRAVTVPRLTASTSGVGGGGWEENTIRWRRKLNQLKFYGRFPDPHPGGFAAAPVMLPSFVKPAVPGAVLGARAAPDPAAGSMLGTQEQRECGVGGLWEGESRARGRKAGGRGHVVHTPPHTSTSPRRTRSLQSFGIPCPIC